MQNATLGGTRFVGRVIVAEALARGWQVTALNRGITGDLPAGVTSLRADRRDAEQLRTALAGRTFDAVIDTWSGAPIVAMTAAAALVGSAERYAYVSSSSVYAWGAHRDEDSLLVGGDASAVDGDYPALKRGAELGVVASFPEAVLARAGLILGPYEDIGRLLQGPIDVISRSGHATTEQLLTACKDATGSDAEFGLRDGSSRSRRSAVDGLAVLGFRSR